MLMYSVDASTLPHADWKDSIATVAIAGRTMGMITLNNIVHSPAPSILAASISGSGIWSTNCFNRNTPMGIAIMGKILAINLSTNPRLTMMMKRGIDTAIGTNINAKVLISNNKFLLGKHIACRYGKEYTDNYRQYGDYNGVEQIP